MTDSIKDRAREAQAAHLGEHEGAEELIAATAALYASVDDLSVDQKTLLVRNAIQRASGLLDLMAHAPNPGVTAGYAAVGHATLAVAGYAVEEYREGLGFTSTGDRKVDDVLDGVKGLLGKFAEMNMTPEQRDLSDRIRAAVDKRVEAGEEFSDAMSDELRKHKREVAEVEAEAPATSTGKEASRYDNGGMYL